MIYPLQNCPNRDLRMSCQEFFHQLLYVNAVNLLLVKIAHCNRVEADFRHRSPQPRLQSPKGTEATFSLRREYGRRAVGLRRISQSADDVSGDEFY